VTFLPKTIQNNAMARKELKNNIKLVFLQKSEKVRNKSNLASKHYSVETFELFFNLLIL
jgi:hypothetical protein